MEINYKDYGNFQDFITDYLIEVMTNGYAMIVVNYEDYQGIVRELFARTINGMNIILNVESADNFDTDIDAAKHNGGNMLVTVFRDNAEIIGEPMIYSSPEAYVKGTYFVEHDARQALEIGLQGKVIPFRISKVKLLSKESHRL